MGSVEGLPAAHYNANSLRLAADIILILRRHNGCLRSKVSATLSLFPSLRRQSPGTVRVHDYVRHAYLAPAG